MKTVLLLVVLIFGAHDPAVPQGEDLLAQNVAVFELSDGYEGIGGATMQDAIQVLQEQTKVPICLEEVEYELPQDGLTLGEALEKLRNLRVRGPLSSRDEVRWARYQEIAKTKSLETVVGIRKKVFRVPLEKLITLRKILDQLVKLDPEYTWVLRGDSNHSVIVILPSKRSVLEWQIEPICTDAKTLAFLYGANGPIGKALTEHNMTVTWFGGNSGFPEVKMNLCGKKRSGEEVFSLTVTTMNASRGWILSGLKDQRFLSF